MATQLPLELPARSAMGREDFFVTPANAAAVALVDQWPNWPSYGAVLSGEPGSGKSHLSCVFREKSDAGTVHAARLTVDEVPQLVARPALIVEGIDDAPAAERALFHLLNLVREEKRTVLLTSVADPSQIPFVLPDLLSRIRALPAIRILPPDDDLLRAVLVKSFADRQLAVSESILTFMIQRMPRSLQSARRIVEEIDRQSLVERAELTRPFVSKVLSRMVNPDLFPEA
jgi:chromosomal replication initiation ATPase DnaA